jgi:hypothetical protein
MLVVATFDRLPIASLGFRSVRHFMNDTFGGGHAADWFVAIGTLVLAVVAVFQQWLQRLIIRPDLHLAARVERPDAEKTRWRIPSGTRDPMAEEDEIAGRSTGGADVYYFRLAITNNGNFAAQDVQVYLSAVEFLRVDKKYEPVARFSPMNLKWAHVNTTTRPVLLPKMAPVFCDMAHIADPQTRVFTGEDLLGVPTGEAVLGLDLEVKSFSRGHLLERGTYRFHLVLAASNHPPRNYKLEVVFPGKWFDDQEKMFREGFGMRLL